MEFDGDFNDELPNLDALPGAEEGLPGDDGGQLADIAGGRKKKGKGKGKGKAKAQAKGKAQANGKRGGKTNDDKSPDAQGTGADADKAIEEPAKLPKTKCQCMGCGKVLLSSQMANNRYCWDDKRVTDRLYYAAAVQGKEKTKWLSDQLGSLTSSIAICKAYKLRFPEWQQKKTKGPNFLTQYREMVQAESGIVFEDDDIMMTEDRYIIEMAKPENGGLTATAARARWTSLWEDPNKIDDIKNCEKRLRVSLSDHVKFINKFSRLKQILQTEKAKTAIKPEEMDRLMNRIMCGHEKVGGDNCDLQGMAKQMVANVGKAANAFEADLSRLGKLDDLLGQQTQPSGEEHCA